MSIELNTSLTNSQAINAALTNAGINIDKTYGNDKPKKFVLAFGPNVRVGNIQLLLQILESEGLQAIRYASGSIHDRRVYIGSYAESVAVLDAQLKMRLLDTSLSESVLIALVTTRMKEDES